MEENKIKAGYYIDLDDDILIVFPDGTYLVYNIHEEDFVVGRVKLEDQSGKFILDFLGNL